MLALFAGPKSAEPGFSDRICNSLGLFARLPAPSYLEARSLFACLPPVDLLPPRNQRFRPPSHWRAWHPAQAQSGRFVLFHGWFDNCGDIAAELGIDATDPARVYGAAVDRWENQADERLLGNYCTIMHDPGTCSARLARSALRAPPLHYFHTVDAIGAASVPRALEVMGLERRLNPRKLVDALYFNPTEDEDFLLGSWRVDLGSIVHLSPGKRQIRCFFDPLEQAHGTNRGKPADLVAEADHLLEEAARVATAGSRAPAIALSAGLDSTNVAARVLRVLPGDMRLKSFTNVPAVNLGQAISGRFCLDEQAGVEAFAALHPRLDPHFTNNAGVDFDHRLDELFLAMGTGQACVAPNFRFLGLFQQAQHHGCDRVLTADMGEATFSSWGDWAYSEYLLTFKWGQLHKALEADGAHGRPYHRRLLSRAVMPLLPEPIWSLVRRLRGHDTGPINRRISGVRADVLDTYSVPERARAAGVSFERDQYAWRRQLRTDQLARGDIESSDYLQGLEQLCEVRLRDVPAYRPLLTFCTSLPTRMFLHDGQMRWLARELGRGLLPEHLRTSRTIGVQYGDWHHLLTPRLTEMRRQLAAARHDPEIESLFDLDRLEHILDSWPEHPSIDDEAALACAFTLPRALTMIRYFQYMTGRNAGHGMLQT